MAPTELSSSVYEQEMLALRHCLHKWRHHLDMQTFTVFSNNRALSFLKTNTNLSKRQLHCLETFMGYKFDIHYVPRERSHAADAFSKQPPDEPSNPEAHLELAHILKVQARDQIENEARQNYKNDEFYQGLIKQIRTGTADERYEMTNQGIYRKYDNGEPRLCIPTS